MEHYATAMFKEVDDYLAGISVSGHKQIDKAREAILYLEQKVKGLKEFVICYEFTGEQQEIDFFKLIKPKLISRHIFNRDVFCIELARPAGSDDTQVEYLKAELDWIKGFFMRNVDFVQYYRSGDTHLDRMYFLRSEHNIKVSRDNYFYDRDPRFSTSGDMEVARILAHEMLQEYLKGEIRKLSTPPTAAGTPAGTGAKWTGRKNDLIEQLYAWDADGCFNNGKISLAQLTAYIESWFGIELGNISSNFYEMKIRNTPTPFLDRLRCRLLDRMGRSKH